MAGFRLYPYNFVAGLQNEIHLVVAIAPIVWMHTMGVGGIDYMATNGRLE